MYPRLAFLLLIAVILAGCGSSAASSPQSSPTAQTAFARRPSMQIDPNRSYSATVATGDGTFVIKLLPKVAPITVNNFVFLARHHYYDHNLIFRIFKGFMFQTGDPEFQNGTGSPGYTIPDEKVTLPYTFGSVAMANTGLPNSGAAQFFVVLAPRYRFKKAAYTIFGKVVSGFNVLQKIANTPVQINPVTQELSDPINDVYVNRITITG